MLLNLLKCFRPFHPSSLLYPHLFCFLVIKTLGKLCYVEDLVGPTNDVRVFIEEFQHSWTYNSACVVPVTYDDKNSTKNDESDIEEDEDDDDVTSAPGNFISKLLIRNL